MPIPVTEYSDAQRLAAFRFQAGFCPWCGNRTIINGKCGTMGWSPQGSHCDRKFPTTKKEVAQMLHEIGAAK